jgi:hypothetical protein
MANSTTNYGKKMVKQKWRQHNIIKYAIWNVRGIAHKELDGVINEEKTKTAAITESNKKFKGTMETQRYIVIYRGVKRGTRAQVGVMSWIHKWNKNTIINYTYWSKRITEVKVNTGRRKLSFFLDSMPQKKAELKKTNTFMTHYWKY